MTLTVPCSCGNYFDVADELAGGVTNCPRCRKAVDVPGLRDPFWRVLQGLAVLGWLASIVGAYVAWGALGAAATAICVAAILWLVSRAL